MKNEVQQFVLPSDYCYMDEADVCQDFTQHQQPINIIINKQTKMEELLKVTVQLTEHAPEYIRVDEKNGAVMCFKHPTLNIYFHQYDDWHERDQTYKLLNDKFNGLFGTFKNQTYSQIGKELMNLMEELPPSYYNKEAHHLLNTYEPKATMDCNKTICRDTHANPENDLDLTIENPIQAIDAYKQFSTVFINISNRTAS